MSQTNTEIQIGTPCTYCIGSDSYPCEIVETSPSGHIITVRDMGYRRTDNNGFSENQEYEYWSNPRGSLTRFSRRKNKKGRQFYRPVGSSVGYLIIGEARAYRDPSF